MTRMLGSKSDSNPSHARFHSLYMISSSFGPKKPQDYGGLIAGIVHAPFQANDSRHAEI